MFCEVLLELLELFELLEELCELSVVSFAGAENDIDFCTDVYLFAIASVTTTIVILFPLKS